MAAIAPMQSAQPQFQQQLPIQTATSSAQDPLFEALVKYITSTPGPSPVSDSQIQTILDSHVNQQGGREWLESIVQPIVNPPQIIKWEHEEPATGFLSTNLDSLTLYFTATRNWFWQKIEFRGTIPGFFPPHVFVFEQNATFYWNDIADKTAVRFELEYLSALSILTVKFYDAQNKLIGELLIANATPRLPKYAISGDGLFRFLKGPQ